jgi:hypothetical protein
MLGIDHLQESSFRIDAGDYYLSFDLLACAERYADRSAIFNEHLIDGGLGSDVRAVVACCLGYYTAD